MSTEFCLEIFFEQDQDREFAEVEADKLHTVVGQLNPNVKIIISIQKASKDRTITEDLYENGKHYSIPYHCPTSKGCQTLLITNEEIGWTGQGRPREGRHWGELGCLSKRKLEDKGVKSAYITVHEWLSTIAAAKRLRIDPDHNEGYPQYQSPDACGEWHSWYRHLLIGCLVG